MIAGATATYRGNNFLNADPDGPRNQIMSSINRRRFLEDSPRRRPLLPRRHGRRPSLFADETKPTASPNEKLRGCVIGCHGRGGEHISELIHRKDVELTYICDVDTKVGNSRCEQIDKSLKGHKPKYAQDLRTVLDDKSVDFVTIATPNHWHSLAAIWAMQAGKDVYVEKPVATTSAKAAATCKPPSGISEFARPACKAVRRPDCTKLLPIFARESSAK